MHATISTVIKFTALLAIFCRLPVDILVSTVHLAIDAYRPGTNPSVIRETHIAVSNAWSVWCLASYVTWTPGTLTLDESCPAVLMVHHVNSARADSADISIRRIERYLLTFES